MKKFRTMTREGLKKEFGLTDEEIDEAERGPREPCFGIGIGGEPNKVGLFFRLKLRHGDGEEIEVAMACDMFEDNGDEEYDS